MLIKQERDGKVLLLTLDRPKALNALNSELLRELEEALDSIDPKETYSVVITGSGDKSFVAGADIAEMKDLDKEGAEEYADLGHRVMRKIETCPVPVIAAINGFALGGGNELAMSCDIRYAADNAVFGQPEVGLGITPGFGGTQRLARVIGSTSKAKEILYTGRNIKADEAYRLGLVSEVLPQEELLEKAMKTAKIIAANAPIAVRETKRAVNEGLELEIEDALDLELDIFSDCFKTEDQKEGMTAFLEKRKEKNFKNS